jgi:hypothetical protein
MRILCRLSDADDALCAEYFQTRRSRPWQYDVNANQVFSWRKRYREDACAPSNSTVPQLVPVVITAEQDAVAVQPPVVTEKIEIDVSGKYRIRVACGFDGQALRRVLDVLERR